jgi:hypothetical protein
MRPTILAPEFLRAAQEPRRRELHSDVQTKSRVALSYPETREKRFCLSRMSDFVKIALIRVISTTKA